MLYVGTWYELIALPVMTRIEVSHFLHRRAPHRTVLDIRAPEKSPEKRASPSPRGFSKRKYQLKSVLSKTLRAFDGWVCDPNRGATALGVVIRRHFERRTSNSSLALRFSTRIAPHYFFGMQDEFLYAPVRSEEHTSEL